MKKYVVMADYSEGWIIAGESDDFSEAVRIRENTLGSGVSHVVIFRLVEFVVSEVTDQS